MKIMSCKAVKSQEQSSDDPLRSNKMVFEIQRCCKHLKKHNLKFAVIYTFHVETKSYDHHHPPPPAGKKNRGTVLFHKREKDDLEIGFSFPLQYEKGNYDHHGGDSID